MDLHGLGTTLPSVQAIDCLASASAEGHNVKKILDQRAAALRLETNRRTLTSVAAVLRVWHVFATKVLEYPQVETLPPKASRDVMQFLCIFRSGSTGCNYVGYVPWTCVHLSLSTEWFAPDLQMTMKGVRKMSMKHGPAVAKTKRLLTEELLSQTVRLADILNLAAWADQALMAWEFLPRVQSEAIELEAGVPDDATAMQAHRHSAVWVDPTGALVLRLQRRKHRQQGSLLQRRSRCKWVLLKVDGAGDFTLKAFSLSELAKRQRWLQRVSRLEPFFWLVSGAAERFPIT